LQGKGLSCEIRIVQDTASLLHFEFLDIRIPGAATPVRICIAIWSGEADPALLKPLLEDGAEFEALSLRISHPRRLSESLLARIAREEVLRHGIPVGRGQFSYSHTSTDNTIIAAAGFAEKAIGIDIEPETSLESREELVSRILTGAERASLDLLPPDRRELRPLELWCAKESLGKALGTGLQAPLAQYETRHLAEPQAGAVVEFRHFPGWRAAIAHVKGLVVAACVPKY
jgi:phosphopantetheinyl transferase (holo-ACP synthase)